MKHTEQKILGIPREWLAVLCGAFFYCYQYILRVSPNVMHDGLLSDFGIEADTLGTMISCYSWSYAGVQIPLGIALDRFGAGKLISLAAFVCALSCFLFSATTNIYVASFALFLMGLGSASGFLGSIKLGTTWFAPQHLAKIIALVMIFGTLGAGLGGTPLSLLIEAVGRQTTFVILGSVGAVLSLCIYGVVGRIPVPLLYEPSRHMLDGLKEVVLSPQAWFISLYSMLMYAPITIMGIAWGVPFLQSVYGIDAQVAATFITVMFIGAAVGSPFFSTISDQIERRNPPMLFGALLSFSLYLIILYVPHIPFAVMYSLFFAAGFAYTAKALSFACICEIMPKSSSAVSVGFINTVVMATGIVFHPLIGKLLVLDWDGSTKDGRDIYSLGDYQFALSIVPICLLLSAVILRYVKETHHKVQMAQKKENMIYLSDLE